MLEKAGGHTHMKGELLFILNPVAGHGRSQRVFSRLQSVLRERGGVSWTTWVTQGPGHARELAREAVREGFRRVIAVGGDGTVHETINGLMDAGGPALPEVCLGVVPAGSGNDLSRNLGVPARLEALAELLASGPAGPMDVGLVNGRHFANVAGVGFDAEVAALANRLPKVLPGTLTYVAGVLVMLARYRNARLTIRIDGQTLSRRALLVAVGNGARYAGGMMICPGARVNDGTFRVVVAGDLSRAEVLRVFPTIYGGGHVRHPKVEVFDARELSIVADRPLFVQADGEIVGTTPATLRMVPGALQVIGLAPEAGPPLDDRGEALGDSEAPSAPGARPLAGPRRRPA